VNNIVPIERVHETESVNSKNQVTEFVYTTTMDELPITDTHTSTTEFDGKKTIHTYTTTNNEVVDYDVKTSTTT